MKAAAAHAAVLAALTVTAVVTPWVLTLAVPAQAVAAEPAHVSAADALAVRRVVEAQLAAFAADDAARAYALATPEIRKTFGDADHFLDMVRAGYPVVYRPASVTFLVPTWRGNVLVQGVHLTDEQGTLWLAQYQLQRQRDRQWRIGGCVVTARTGQTT